MYRTATINMATFRKARHYKANPAKLYFKHSSRYTEGQRTMFGIYCDLLSLKE